jgi:hypothetical protein
MALWLLGHPDQARATLRQACARAEQIEQPSGAALAHLMAGISYLIMGRDLSAALSHSQALQPLGAAGLEYGAWAKLLAAPAQARGGQTPSEASGQGGARAAKPALEWCLDQAAEAGSAMQALGSGVGYASQLLVQAGLCAWAGQVERGVGAMDRALAWIERTGVRDIEAEVWRMRGELVGVGNSPPRPERREPRSSDGQDDEAEASFRRALGIAREQQARWLELRAAVSLARLWHSHGRCDEARGLLAGIFGWFTEGFDLADLVEAKALLEALA